MPWGLAIGAVAGLGSYFAQKSANDRAQMVSQENFQNWMNLAIPNPEQQKLALQRFVSTGELAPQMQQAIAQQPSEFQKIVTNPTYQGAENKALSELSDIGNKGGLRLQDKEAIQEATLKGQAQERANRLGIADEMGRRGLSGSGYDVAARLSGQQGVADRLSTASLKTASDAQDRALQAILGAGKLAGDIRGQDFQEKGAKAAASDKINAFNTANLRDVNAANTQAQNAAQEFNLKNKQRISDQNTQLSNQEQQANKALLQQQFENEQKRLAGASGQANQIAAGERAGGLLVGNTISNLGGAAANYATLDAYFGNKNKTPDTASTSSAANSANGSGYVTAQKDTAQKDDDEEDYYPKPRYF